MLQSIDLADSARGNQYTGPLEPDPGEQVPILLRDLGITKSDSSRSQRIADVPADVFERYIAVNSEADREPTLTGLFRLIKQCQPCHVDDDGNATQPDVINGLASFVEAGYRFATIYADPPWPLSTGHTRRRLLNVEQIAAEGVANLCQDMPTFTFGQATPRSPSRFAVVKAWGFATDSSPCVPEADDGARRLLARISRVLAVGSSGQLPFSDSNQPSWIECEWPEDGNKPDSIRELVEAVSPGPYLFMYGNLQPNGDWSVYPGPDDRNPEP